MAKSLELWPIERLHPYDKNPRTHSPKQVAQIAASITEFGFTNPILVDSRDGIIAGHGRYSAAQILGLDVVPVVVLDHLSEDQRRAYIIADNKLAEQAGWDEELLAGEMLALEEASYDLTLTGFDEAEIEELLAVQESNPSGNAPGDQTPPFELQAVSRTGDVWCLGRHRVCCGDARSLEAIKALMGKGKADCLWTDPPEREDREPEDFAALLQESLAGAAIVMRSGAAIYLAHDDRDGLAVRQAFEACGFVFQTTLIWRKNVVTKSRFDYHAQHEPILYGWKAGPGHAFYGNRLRSTFVELDDPLFQQIDDDEWQIALGETTLIVRGKGVDVERVHGTVFYEDKPKRHKDHPRVKPVALIERQITNSTKAGGVVLDTFAGAGSTVIACERTGRVGRLLELAGESVDVIVRRWEEYTGSQATLEADGSSFADVTAARVPPATRRKK